LHPPDEIMVHEFLPALRQLVSLKLSSEGVSQTRIAAMLGVTQASVSIYLSSDSDGAYSSLSGLSLLKQEVDALTSLLAEDAKVNPAYAVGTLESTWTGLLGRGRICTRHRAIYPELADCEVCMVQFGPPRGGSTGAIEQVAEAIRMIEGSKSFVSVMPEVAVNIACVEGESDSPEDVVAIPGRIVRVRNTARAMRRPEFGASRHLAQMLLLVKGKRPEYRAVINLRYDEKMARALRRGRVKTLEIGGPYPAGAADPTVAALKDRLTYAERTFGAVVDLGGKGLEANVYLFGRSAVEVARLAIRISGYYLTA
jgi:XRE family transcriptional regulator, thiamine biosynthesis regulator